MIVESFVEEFEQNLLGSVLIDNQNLDKIIGELEPKDFYYGKHQIIYQAMLRMKAEERSINVLTLRIFLENENKSDNVVNSSEITYLTELVVIPTQVTYYAREIKKSSNKRKQWESCHNIAKAIENNESAEIIEDKIERLREIPNSRFSTNPLKPISANDLADIPPPQSLWANILFPGFITQINAEPGAGKSTFAYNIAANGALDRDFLNISFFKRIKTLYIDLETPQSLCRNKIELICGDLPKDFFILDSLDLKTDFKHLLLLCKKEKFDLVVLDTQSRVFNMQQENDNSETNILMGHLRRLAKETESAILLVHHTTKGDGGKAAYKGRGASAIAASVDLVVNLQSLDKETLELDIAKSRMPNNNHKMIIRKVGNDRFELHTDSNTTYFETKSDIQKIQELIIFQLSEANSELRTAEILCNLEQQGFKKRNIEDGLRRLNKTGKIVKLKQGIYTLPSEEISANPAHLYPCGTAEPAEKVEKEEFKLEI